MNETPKCHNSKYRVARKGHKCMGCGTNINAGDRYLYTSGIWDEPQSFKHCLNCDSVLNNYYLIDKTLAPEDGPSLDWMGVQSFVCEFIYDGWKGEQAARDLSDMFSVNLDYARSLIPKNQLTQRG